MENSTTNETTGAAQALNDVSSSSLLTLGEQDFDDVATGLMNAYDFALIRSGGLHIQHQPDGELIRLDNHETVKGVFDFCRFVDAIKI